MYRIITSLGAAAIISASFIIGGCGGGAKDASPGLEGTIAVDGSSTVFPITEAVAEEFQKLHRKARVTVGISGTGGGFKKFCAGETDICDASRPIKPKEIAAAAANNIEYIELPIAFDGLSVVVNPKNMFVDYLTTDELKMIWQPGSTVDHWSDVRPSWPGKPITLYGPGMDSGTFDYFTKAVNGKEQACRPDFTASEDDNVLVRGIAGDENSLGFFGFAYYYENKSRLKIVPIDGGDGPIAPSAESINNGSYKPLSRPIFIYVRAKAASRPEVESFVEFYMENVPELAAEVGYIPLPETAYGMVIDRFKQRIKGSAFSGRKTVGLSIDDVLNIEG